MQQQGCLVAMLDILRPLTPHEVEEIVRRGSGVHLEVGETFDMAEDRRALFLLVSGRVRVFEPNHAGRDLTLSVVEGGTVLGQTGFSARRVSRVEALEPSVVRSLGWDDFEDLARRNSEVGVMMVRLLSERLGVCEDRLSDLVRKEVPARLASLILKFSEYQGIVVSDGSRKVPTRFTHQQLASMVGANREAVSRAFGKLTKGGGVEVRDRHIHVTDTAALEHLAEATR
jgi:CRP/FNR family transcriptional regulator, cyclic AMP receptor protein